MDIINVSRWNNSQVIQWFQGLDESLRKYIGHLRESNLSGEQLLLLTHHDLHKLDIHLVAHQELILDSVRLLQQLDYGLDSETLQSRALCLKCRCRGMKASIGGRRREADEYGYDGGVSLQRGATNQLLMLAADVLDEGKQLIMWLDRTPFNQKEEFQSLRDTIVKLCYELSVTMQQSVFACVIEDAALNICNEMEVASEGVIQSNDPLTIQPVTIEQVFLKGIDPTQGLGLYIKATFEGHHVVTGTRSGSVGSKARKISAGDEVIAVNGKAVVGWTLGALVSCLKENGENVSLLMKKRPQMLTYSTSNLLTYKQRQDYNQGSRHMRAAAPVRRIHGNRHVTQSAVNLREVEAIAQTNGTWSNSINNGNGVAMPTHYRPPERIVPRHRSSSASTDYTHSYNPPSSAFKHRSGNSFDNTEPHFKFESPLKTPKMIPTPKIPTIPQIPQSPIEVLKIPPPPAEPYTPKEMSRLVVRPNPQDHIDRSASPNSLLDIDHRRRYTVIGDSEADQAWYDDFISQVNKCNIATSSGKNSRDISSSESVFAPVHQRPIEPHEHAVFYRRKPKSNPSRPLSMPPNYYSPKKVCPAKLINSTNNILHEEPSRYYKQINNKLPDSCPKSPENYPGSRYGWYNNNNNNNKSSTSTLSTAYNTDSNSSKNSYRNNNSSLEKSLLRNSVAKKVLENSVSPPKPPPRSSSISKLLSHQNSGDRAQSIDKSSRASPSDENMNEKNNDSELPRSISKKSKKMRSVSTPSLHQVQPPSMTSPTHQGIPQIVIGDGVKSVDRNQRPIPKPRSNAKSRTISHEAVDRKHFSELMPAPVANRRRRSEGNVAHKKETVVEKIADGEIDGIIERLQLSPSPKTTPVTSQSPINQVTIRSLSPRNSPPTSRISYTSAIANTENLSSQPLEVTKQDTKSLKNIEKRTRSSSKKNQHNKNFESALVAGVPIRLRKSLTRLTSSSSNKNSPEKPSNELGVDMKSQRRISCRDLGQCDCMGWLWKKKNSTTPSSAGPLSIKWSKRYVVIKGGSLYCYRSNADDDSRRAESYISLPGYQVAPAPECKRKMAFRISHPKRKTFYFAAERQTDMGKWMNKMGLAAIEYFGGEDEKKDIGAPPNGDKYYSEESDDGEDSLTFGDSPSKYSSSDDVFGGSSPGRDRARPAPSPNGDLRKRSQSESVKRDKDELDVIKPAKSTTSLVDEDSPRSSPRLKPSVSPEQRRHRGNRQRHKMLGVTSSDSINSLASSNGESDDEDAKKLRRIREQAAKQAENIKKSRNSLTPVITVNPSSPTDTHSLQSERSASSLSSQEKSTSSSSQIEASPRRDAAGRPKVTKEDMTSQSSSDVDISTTSEKAALLSEELVTSQSGYYDLHKSLKRAECDVRGINRRVTLRRKMTVLSRDPVKNERMLKKRALERDLKAKELELAYYNQLFSGKQKINSKTLHDWINNHPSLVAEMGTIRRMSKRKRPPLEASGVATSSQGVAANFNENNNNPSRPRSRALTGDVRNILPVPKERASRMTSSPPSTNPSGKKHVRPQLRHINSYSDSRPPYLETDL